MTIKEGIINYINDLFYIKEKELENKKAKMLEAINWFEEAKIHKEIQSFIGVELKYNNILCVCKEIEINDNITFTLIPKSIHDDIGNGFGAPHKIKF